MGTGMTAKKNSSLLTCVEAAGEHTLTWKSHTKNWTNRTILKEIKERKSAEMASVKVTLVGCGVKKLIDSPVADFAASDTRDDVSQELTACVTSRFGAKKTQASSAATLSPV
ncbi:hypothetical protein Slin15195_G130490 [Septoria linicola]|uniref:Uncharacterized protein n=1 Tax=Septoria linicola TaxID=215465 RepID=A0A9Q9ER30_9PEZI|nr:hypothetical protein Slin14017_G122330 [Septoria linicola]USW59730.1 hypothetical protein Slin15195_G130490 [Septoria linicola]